MKRALMIASAAAVLAFGMSGAAQAAAPASPKPSVAATAKPTARATTAAHATSATHATTAARTTPAAHPAPAAKPTVAAARPTPAPRPTAHPTPRATPVHRTAATAPAPQARGPNGATAKCGDGTYSTSKTRTGTCAGHKGVAQWY